jgi:hypothetical protein
VCCRILGEEEFVAVLFYEEKKRESMKALQHLEMIDDEADLFSIRQAVFFQTKYFFLSLSLSHKLFYVLKR